MAAPTLVDIRKIEWGKSYLWELYFPSNTDWGIDTSTYTVPPDPPFRFQKWFPASNVTEPVFNITTRSINSPMVNFNVPQTLSSSDLSLTFYETIYHEIREWLWEWCMYMFGINFDYNTLAQEFDVVTSKDIQGVRPLSECVRPCILHKYNSDHTLSKRKEFMIYPSGVLAVQLSSESSTIDESCTFSVASGMFSRSPLVNYQNPTNPVE